MAGTALRVWRTDGRKLRLLAGRTADWEPDLGDDGRGGTVETPDGPAWFEPVPAVKGVWLEVPVSSAGAPREAGAAAEIVGAMLDSEREMSQVAQELRERYEEIDLLYTISEVLGHTI